MGQVGPSGFRLVGITRFRAEARMPACAREWAAGLAAPFVAPEVLDTIRLLASEVATNAFRHGCAAGGVQVALLLTEAGGVRVEVRDEGAGVPRRRAAAEDDEDGRGLLLLDALARAWGHAPAPDGPGTVVWFEVDPGTAV
ncbi:ATP-binding protein [Actinocorallia aurea]